MDLGAGNGKEFAYWDFDLQGWFQGVFMDTGRLLKNGVYKRGFRATKWNLSTPGKIVKKNICKILDPVKIILAGKICKKKFVKKF